MLERVQRKGNPLALLVEMQIDIATMENSMVVPLKSKNRSTVCPRSPTTGHITRKNLISNGCIHHNVHCSTVYMEATLNVHQQRNGQQRCGTYIQMEYQSVRKRNEIGSFVEMWMDVETVILSEVSQRKTKKVYLYMYVESRKMIQMNVSAEQEQRCKCRE